MIQSEDNVAMGCELRKENRVFMATGSKSVAKNNRDEFSSLDGGRSLILTDHCFIGMLFILKHWKVQRPMVLAVLCLFEGSI